MLLTAKQIIGLRAETRSGRNLGRVRDFDVDADSLEIKNFYVRPAGIVKGFASGDLIIDRKSVLSVDAEKVTVLDLAEKEFAGAERAKKLAIGESPVSASVKD